MRNPTGIGAVALAVAALAVTGVQAADEVPQKAVWKEQSIEFVYFGRTSSYSCDGIRDKLRLLLGQMGARRDIRMLASGCAEAGDMPRQLRSLSPSVRLAFFVPALPDPAARPARAGDPAQLDAGFVPFTITADPFRNMQLGDCELVDEFARQVLPRFTTRDVQRDITCVPYQLSGSHYTLRGEVLKALRATPAAAGR